MSFLFPQKKPKTLNEVVYALNEWILRVSDANTSAQLQNGHSMGLNSAYGTTIVLSDQQKQAVEESGKLLAHIRRTTWGNHSDSGSQPEPEQLAALAKEVYGTDVLVPLIQNLRALDFDARRDVANFFGYMLERQPTVDYLLHKVPEVFSLLLTSAGEPEVHRAACQMLRECAKHEALVAYVLNLQLFWRFFQYIDDVEFEVATDNFSTFQEFLRGYPDLTTSFILRNKEYFTQCINGLIRSDNYVAKRQSLRLLYQLVKQQRNHQYLIYYCNSLDNLKMIMRLLKDKSKNIHYEAFQMFKCFVAYPNRPKCITDVLVRNKTKLLGLLKKDHKLGDRHEDQLYQTERNYVRDKILALPDRDPAETSATASPATAPAPAAPANPDHVPSQSQPQTRSQPQSQPQSQSQSQSHSQSQTPAAIDTQLANMQLNLQMNNQALQQQQQQQAAQQQQQQQQQQQHLQQQHMQHMMHMRQHQPAPPQQHQHLQHLQHPQGAPDSYFQAHPQNKMRPRSPTRAQAPPAVLDARPASPVLSRVPAQFHHK